MTELLLVIAAIAFAILMALLAVLRQRPKKKVSKKTEKKVFVNDLIDEDGKITFIGLKMNALTVIAVIMSIVYFSFKMFLGGANNPPPLTLIGILIGSITLISQVRGFELPGKVGTWGLFLFTVGYMLLDVINAFGLHMGFLKEPINDWASFVGMFDGNFTILSILGIFLIACALLGFKKWASGMLTFGSLIMIMANYTLFDQKMRNLANTSTKMAREMQFEEADIPREFKSYSEISMEFNGKNNEVIELDCKNACLLHADGKVIVDGNEDRWYNCTPKDGCINQQTRQRPNFKPEDLENGMPSIAAKTRLKYGQLMYSTDGTNFQNYVEPVEILAETVYVARWVHIVVESKKRSSGTGWIIGTYQTVSDRQEEAKKSKPAESDA